MATASSTTFTKSKTVEKTVREVLPDGTVRVKTTIEKTLPNGRTVIEERTNTERPSSLSLSTTEKPASSRFKLPTFFQSSAGKINQTTKVSSSSNSSNSALPLSEYRQQLLNLQNQKRVKHGVGNLIMMEKLNSVAQEWAEHLAKIGSLEHRKKSEFGENIFMGYDSSAPIAPSQVINRWYSEVENYNYDRPSVGSTGHFTQMVWRNSKEVGFGCSTSKDGRCYVVANYFPPGNMIGTFKENVLRPSF